VKHKRHRPKRQRAGIRCGCKAAKVFQRPTRRSLRHAVTAQEQATEGEGGYLFIGAERVAFTRSDWRDHLSGDAA